MSAAIIHLVNISGTNPNASPALTELATNYLADAIRSLGIMHQTLPVIIRYVKAIRNLTQKWLPVVPERIKEAMVDAEMRSSATSIPSLMLREPNTSAQISDNHDSPLTNGTTASISNNDLGGSADRRHSVPELISSQYSLGNNNLDPNTPDSSTPNHQQQYFWTPFPDHQEGVPLALPTGARNQHMDITSMLDSGVDGDWAQLNRDGFTMGGGVNRVDTIGEDVGGNPWSMTWDGNT
jgi:hypothetical protein